MPCCIAECGGDFSQADTSGALNGVTVGGHVINMFLLPKKGTPVLHNSNSKLLENWAWARNSLTKSPSYHGHVTHICVTIQNWFLP